MLWRAVLLVLFLGAGVPLSAADSDEEIVARINQFVRQGWEENEVQPSPVAPDGEWARRVSLDLVGHIPAYDELLKFLEDESADKKAKYVNQLLDQPDYVQNWTTIWGNLLVGRNDNNRAELERWLRKQFYQNQPYNRFVYELVAAEGSVAENGAAAFLSAHLNEQAVPATSITSRVFLGLQVQCTQCHNHPFNDWKQDQFWSMNAFFRGTSRQGGRDSQMLVDAPHNQVVFFEKRSGLMEASRRKFVDGTPVVINGEVKPRQQLADLITDPTKPFLARAQINRMWGHFFGYAFTRPADDMGPHNPPSHPELLDCLADQFRQANYDPKRLIRWIVLSEAYGLSSQTTEQNTLDNPAAGETPLFSHMYLKNFTAEQLYDSLLIATQADQTTRDSDAAQQQRAVWLRQFVQTFGTDENDDFTTFNGTIPQALVMMNGDLTRTAISGNTGSFLQQVLDSPTGDIRKSPAPKKPPRFNRPPVVDPRNRSRNIPAKIETLFLVALARRPSEEELNRINELFQNRASRDPIEGLQDIFWAILNSNEFIINH